MEATIRSVRFAAEDASVEGDFKSDNHFRKANRDLSIMIDVAGHGSLLITMEYGSRESPTIHSIGASPKLERDVSAYIMTDLDRVEEGKPSSSEGTAQSYAKKIARYLNNL